MCQIAEAAKPATPSAEVPLRDVIFLKEANVRRHLIQGLQGVFRIQSKRTHVVRKDDEGHIRVQELRTKRFSSNPQWAKPVGTSKCHCVLDGHVVFASTTMPVQAQQATTNAVKRTTNPVVGACVWYVAQLWPQCP